MAFVIAFLTFVTLVGVPQAFANCQTVTLTGNPEYPPVTWRDATGNLVGSYIEFTVAVLQNIGVKGVPKVRGNWKRAQEEVKSGNIDMLIGPWFNKDRDKWLVYIQPHVSLDPAVVFVKSGKEFKFVQLSDLEDKVGIMQRGTSLGFEVDQYLSTKVQLDLVSSWKSAFQMLAGDRGDFIAHGLFAGQLEIIQNGLEDKISILPTPLTEDEMYIAMSRASKCLHLVDNLGKAVANLKKNGLHDRLTEKYIEQFKRAIK